MVSEESEIISYLLESDLGGDHKGRPYGDEGRLGGGGFGNHPNLQVGNNSGAHKSLLSIWFGFAPVDGGEFFLEGVEPDVDYGDD